MSHPKIAIVCGEISGDQYASLLALHLRKIQPDTEIIGIGGRKLSQSGVKIIAKNPLSGSFGIYSVIRNIHQHIKFLNLCASAIRKENPDLIIFIDNPGFNLNLAKKLTDFRKIYYIVPKVWAHGYQRIFLIRHLFEAAIVIFPFEKKLFEKEGVSAFYFGHPVIDLIENSTDNNDFFETTGLNEQHTVIGLFPGSRKEEIEWILPVLLKAGKFIQKDYKVCFVVSCADENLLPIIKKIIEKERFHCSVWTGSPHVIARVSHLALVASGTMNLELALLETPMIVFYKMNRLNYIIARIVVQLQSVNPVNIICGKKVVEEFIQDINWLKFNRVFSQIMDKESEKRKTQIEYFKSLKEQLGCKNVSERVAQFILERVR